jgi:DNA-binding transcriptional MerR regulator
MKENNSEYLNSRQMAARMGVSTRSLERYRADGLIPFIPLTKRAYLYNPQKVFAILESIEIPCRRLKGERISVP